MILAMNERDILLSQLNLAPTSMIGITGKSELRGESGISLLATRSLWVATEFVTYKATHLPGCLSTYLETGESSILRLLKLFLPTVNERKT